MTWTSFVISLIFIVGTQAYYEACDGNKPWSLEYLREHNHTVSILDGTLKSHAKRMQEWQNKAYAELYYLEIDVTRLYTESTLSTKWEKVKGISQKQAVTCYDLISQSMKENVLEFINNKRTECDVLAKEYPKVKSIMLDWNNKDRRWKENQNMDEKEEAIKIYVDICKLSGHVTPALDEIIHSIEIIRQKITSEAEDCYDLIVDEPGIKEESIKNVRQIFEKLDD